MFLNLFLSFPATEYCVSFDNTGPSIFSDYHFALRPNLLRKILQHLLEGARFLVTFYSRDNDSRVRIFSQAGYELGPS